MKSLIILAGGIGTRMEEVGIVLPKVLLPINGEILLFRTIRQATKAGIKSIFICTTNENKDIVERTVNKLNNSAIRVISFNKATLLESLLKTGKYISKHNTVVLSLGDIFYLDNPFLDLRKAKYKGDVLIGKETSDPKILRNGGIIEVSQKGEVIKISKDKRKIERGVRWSGASVLGEDFFSDLKKYIKEPKHNSSLEGIFEYRNKNNRKTTTKTDIDFVNINSNQHHMYANLLSFSKNNKSSKKELKICINNIRESILKHDNQI